MAIRWQRRNGAGIERLRVKQAVVESAKFMGESKCTCVTRAKIFGYAEGMAAKKRGPDRALGTIRAINLATTYSRGT